MSPPVSEPLARIRAWGEARDWRGWDPYDGLNSPVAGALTLGTRPGRRALTQAVKLSPVNLRPLLGIRPAHNDKAIGLVASGYARLHASGDATALAPARRWLSWLAEHAHRDEHGAAWGYHFPVQTRVFRYERGVPNVIATSFVAHALLDGVELLGERAWGEQARAAVGFLRGPLHAGPHFAYLEGEAELVHNANLLACSVLARAARVLGDAALLEAVGPALAVTLADQRPDGSWPYADRSGHDWVDNFHTGYVLDALAECARSLPEAIEPLERGVQYWRAQMFLADGTPRYYAHKTHPLDAHCYATAIDTWLALRPHRADALEQAERIAARLIEDGWIAPAGYVRFQRRRRWRNSVALVRWTTAPTFKAFAGLLHARLG